MLRGPQLSQARLAAFEALQPGAPWAVGKGGGGFAGGGFSGFFFAFVWWGGGGVVSGVFVVFFEGTFLVGGGGFRMFFFGGEGEVSTAGMVFWTRGCLSALQGSALSADFDSLFE